MSPIAVEHTWFLSSHVSSQVSVLYRSAVLLVLAFFRMEMFFQSMATKVCSDLCCLPPTKAKEVARLRTIGIVAEYMACQPLTTWQELHQQIYAMAPQLVPGWSLPDQGTFSGSPHQKWYSWTEKPLCGWMEMDETNNRPCVLYVFFLSFLACTSIFTIWKG